MAAEPTDPMPGMEHSMLLTSLDDEAIDALVAAVGDRNTCPLTIIQIRGLGGAFAEEPALGGAVRTVVEPFNVFALGIPAVPELAEAIPLRVRGHRRRRRPPGQRSPDAELHR